MIERFILKECADESFKILDTEGILDITSAASATLMLNKLNCLVQDLKSENEKLKEALLKSEVL